jgi:pimeloyl-ACP methyl ester carboxylesterase
MCSGQKMFSPGTQRPRREGKLSARRLFVAVLAVLSAFTSPAARAQSFAYPPGFRTEEIGANGTTIHVRIGGSGPAVVLLHGYGDTGDMWAPLASELMRDHTIIAPDLRGMGLSATATDGFTKKNQAEDVAGVLDALHIRRADVVGHDIGNMVAFAFAAAHQDRTTRLVMMDAPVPGVGPWDEILKNPLLWHFRFGGPDMERLVAGRERIYLDRFWNEFSADPAHFPEASRQHYARVGDRWRPFVRVHHGLRRAVRRGRRARGRDRQFRPLADGRAARPHDRGHSRFLAKRRFERCLAENAPDGGSGRRDSARRRGRWHVWSKRSADYGSIRRPQCARALCD